MQFINPNFREACRIEKSAKIRLRHKRKTREFNLTLSDDAYWAMNAAAIRTRTNMSEVLRKSITLYMTCLEAQERGKKIGICNSETKELETEFLGL
jgi:hypothetical protein